MPSAMRVLRAAVLSAGAVLTALAGAAALFLLHPQAFVTPRSAAFLLARLAAAYGPRWEGLEASAEPLGHGRHRYRLGLTGLCFADAAGAVDACFERIEAAVTVSYGRRGVALEKVERFVALGRRLRLEPAKRRPGGRGPAAFLSWPGSGVGAVRVELPSVVVAGARGTARGRFSAAFDPRAVPPLSVRAAFSSQGPGFRGTLTAEASGDAERSNGSAEFRSETGRLRGIKLSRCRLRAAAPSELACRFAVSPLLGADARLDPLRSLTGALRLTGAVSGRGYALGLTASFDPLRAWVRAHGRVSAEAKGTFGEAPALLELRADLDAGAVRFEDVVARLRDSAYAVPAPFHVLTGPLTLKAAAHGDPRRDPLRVDLSLAGDLSGGRQRLAWDAAATLTAQRPSSPPRSVRVDADVLIKEAAFELPKLEITGVPKGTLDPRIRLAEAGEGLRDAPGAAPAPAAPGGVTARVVLRTAKPLTLSSNLVDDPVPVSLDLVGEYPPAAGSGLVAVGGFGVELFRRHAVVDHVNVRLSTGGPHGALEGLITYRMAGFVVSIRLSGTTQRPLVEFSSVPALSREEILALLIFGKRPGDLDPEALASVGNTQKAIESRSFGLASLYLFGAMPIEHVSYDAASNNATVKLRLPGGALLQLGSDFERSRGLTLRQPLAPHWAIQSEFSQQGPESRFGTTFLEWFNRY